MATILTRVLSYFQSTMPTVSAGERNAPLRVDIEAPVTPVLDVRPMAERESARLAIGQTSVNPNGPGRDGLFCYSAVSQGAGATAVAVNLQLTPTFFAGYGLDSTKFEFWWVDSQIQGITTAATVTAFDAGLHYQGLPGPVYGSVNPIIPLVSGTTNVLYATPNVSTILPSYHRQGPLLVPMWSTLRVVFKGTNLVTYTVHHVLEIRPK